MNVFDYDDYKKCVNDHIQSLPKGGRGQYRRLAESLNTNSAIITQIFKGDRELTAEQALLLADYFGLSKAECKYLLLLVNYSRAGNHRYKKMLKEEIDEYRLKFHEIKTRVAQNLELKEETKSILYSNWYYLAVWSLTAIDGFHSVELISDRLGLSKKKTREAVDFLLKHSLIVEDKLKLKVGPTLIHLETDSPLISRHHQSWRLKAFQRYEEPRDKDAFYTAPVTLSEADAKKLRANILKFITESVNLIKDSPSEKLYCFCLDWFEV